jgi:hypothetical protein
MKNYPYEAINLYEEVYRIIPQGTSCWFLVNSEKELLNVQKKVNRIFKNPERAKETLKNYYLQVFKSKKDIILKNITLKKGTFFYCKDSFEGSGKFEVLGIFEKEVGFRCPHFGIMDEIFEPKSYGKFLNLEDKEKISLLNKQINNF